MLGVATAWVLVRTARVHSGYEKSFYPVIKPWDLR